VLLLMNRPMLTSRLIGLARIKDQFLRANWSRASDEGCGAHPGAANGDESTWDERRNMDELRFDMGKLETQ
jgi:hypothetical protein